MLNLYNTENCGQPAVYKLIAQIIAACIVIYGGFEYRQIFGIILPRWISVPLTILWIISIINAYNLIDGLDGLCGGLVVLTDDVRTHIDPYAGYAL